VVVGACMQVHDLLVLLLIATVVYSLLITSDKSVSMNQASRDAINKCVVGSSSLYPHDLSAHHPNN
jgi:hypothetical protein